MRIINIKSRLKRRTALCLFLPIAVVLMLLLGFAYIIFDTLDRFWNYRHFLKQEFSEWVSNIRSIWNK